MKAVTLSELSSHLADQGFPNRLDGNPEILIKAVNTLHDAGESELSFLSNPKYRTQLAKTHAAAVIASEEDEIPSTVAALRCGDPYAAVAAAIDYIHGVRQHPIWGRDPLARIAANAVVGENANIGPFVTIDEQAAIGRNVTIYPGCFIGRRVTIGNDVTLYPNVVIYDGSWVGDRVTLHAGTVVGQDGLGYAPVEDHWVKIPQAGRVVIEDDVEMGAGCAIDRATLGETRIGLGTKFSDHVVVGHGTKVGRNGMFVAQTGIAGSVTIGNHVTMGGQVGVAGHLTIGDNVTIGAKSGVWTDIESNQRYFGSPAFKWKQFWRQVACLKEIPALERKLRHVESEVEKIHDQLKGNE